MTPIRFPEGFLWGTSTAAAQIETASAHNWRGLRSKDGHVFGRTTDHELRREADAALIARFGTVYRCGVDWARLQSAPFAPFDEGVVREYLQFFDDLRGRGMRLMFVVHHFTQPLWFEENGGWLAEGNLSAFMDYARQCIVHFGSRASYWNTFNEPNVFALNAYALGSFPPHQKSLRRANRVLRHMGKLHEGLYALIKSHFPNAPIGISQNTAIFRGDSLLGKPFAAFTDWWFNVHAANYFKTADFQGLSYYALIPFRPRPINEVDQPGRLAQLGYPHDKMWAYYPEGLGIMVRRFWKRRRLPIIITENGICSDDPQARIGCLRDYLRVLKTCIDEGIPVKGYIHWSTWDNFEWNIGPSYRFGLLRTNWDSMERENTPAADFYEHITKTNGLDD